MRPVVGRAEHDIARHLQQSEILYCACPRLVPALSPHRRGTAEELRAARAGCLWPQDDKAYFVIEQVWTLYLRPR